MRLGLHLISFTFPDAPIGPTLARVGEVAEAVGIDSLSLMDHYFQMDQWLSVTEPMLEGYTGLAFLAAHTSTVRLGLLVTGVSYRHPGLLAKVVTTLDVLSGGRAELGIGAAWYEREHHALGVPFPPVAERFGRLEEAIQICLQMWDPDDNGPYRGTYYQLAETLCSPAPLSRPRPPILIGGGGERKTLRLVAQYADACNLFATSPDEVSNKLDVLVRHCDDVGRDPDTIRRTMLYVGGPLNAGDTDGFAAEMEGYAKLGIDEVMVMPPHGRQPEAWIEETAVPTVARLANLA